MAWSYHYFYHFIAKFKIILIEQSTIARPLYQHIKMRLVLFLLPLSTTAFSPTRSSIIYRSFGLIPSSTFRKDTHTKSLQHYRHIKPSPPTHQCQQRQITTIHASSENSRSDTNNMKILGVCGGIGSGKSTACQLMVDSLGCVARIGEYTFLYKVLVYCL